MICRSFSAVSDSNLSLTALVLRGWYGVMSGAGLHDLDGFLRSMDCKLASDAAVQQKNMFLRRSLGEHARGGAGAGGVSGSTTPTSKSTAPEPRSRTASPRGGGGPGAGAGGGGGGHPPISPDNNGSRRTSFRVDEVSVALERMRTDASEGVAALTGGAEVGTGRHSCYYTTILYYTMLCYAMLCYAMLLYYYCAITMLYHYIVLLCYYTILLYYYITIL
jgi:hypothetical protein